MSFIAPAIEFRNVSKSFGPIRANHDVSFKIQKGEIHAIVGENGAGKSTLMKILFGLYQPDEGQILLHGNTDKIINPARAKAQKIGMVHQHFMLAGPLTALDHVILESTKGKLFHRLNRSQVRSELESLSNRLQMPVPWNARVEGLPVGIQQRLEILKLLYLQSEILILDEPTAVLTPQETDEFLKRLLKLKEQGKTIILITHKLKEVLAIADSITIFRQGKVVGSGPRSKWTVQSLGEAMIGEPLISANFQERPAKYSGKNLLTVKDLFGKLSFNLEQGEIIGIAGVEGNGQSELIQALLNPLSIKNPGRRHLGQCLLENKELLQCHNLEIRKMGVGYLAEDRQSKGILLDGNLIENFMLGTQDLWSENGILQFSKVEEKLRKAIAQFSIKVGHFKDKISSLSGGNQQKLVVARELSRPLKLLVAAQPTRGVDIGAIEKIHETILDQRKSGTGVLLISSELEELIKLSDRILVLYRSEILAEFTRTTFDEKKIGAVMGGIKP